MNPTHYESISVTWADKNTLYVSIRTKLFDFENMFQQYYSRHLR